MSPGPRNPASPPGGKTSPAVKRGAGAKAPQQSNPAPEAGASPRPEPREGPGEAPWSDFLIEIGTEEIPARMLPGAAAELRTRLVAILSAAGLAHGEPRVFAAPRRLAVLVPGLATRQEDREEDLIGPPASVALDASGALTGAGLGFAKKAGVDPSMIMRVSTPKGDYVGVHRTAPGRAASEILAEQLPGAVAGMPFPKTMRWGAGERRFVRPVRWVVALLGGEVVPMEILGVAAGRTTSGHRILARRMTSGVPLASAGDYEVALNEAGVVPSRQARRGRLERKLEELAAAAGVRVVPDPDLLEEIADLVEFPGAVIGAFPEEFLDLPREILATTLRHHQKAFSTETPAGLAANRFLAVADTDRDAAGHVRRGNEWVVTGRLEDARFFFAEDRRRPLASRLEKLGSVTFHAKAGSYREKVDRIGIIAGQLARRLAAAGLSVDHAALTQAAQLCKCDLVTGTVGEFPELQGVVGGLLLRAEGCADRVAAAIAEHYRPVGAGGRIPTTLEGQLLSIADRLDSFLELSRIADLPTGTKDPFALRRAAFGMIRIVIEGELPLSLEDLYHASSSRDSVFQFLLERLTFWLRENGSRADTVLAVLGAGGASRVETQALPALRRRVLELESRRDRSDFIELIDMYKRCRNIVEHASIEPGTSVQAMPAKSFAGSQEETTAYNRLVEAIDDLAPAVTGAVDSGRYEAALDTMVAIRPFLSRYFEHVLVMSPDLEQRVLRLGPIRNTATFMKEVADFACIQMSRDEIQQQPASPSNKESIG